MTDNSIRLTPGDAPGYIAEYRRVNDAYCHQIRLNGGRQVIPLSPAEALAFARQLPEVEALVEALRYYAQSIQYITTYKYRGGELLDAEAPIAEDAGAKARAVLAPFEEARDGN